MTNQSAQIDHDPNISDHAHSSTGILAGLGAYLWWGLVPIYFKAVSHVSHWEVLGHRVIWSMALLGVIVLALGRKRRLRDALCSKRSITLLLLSSILISVNWLTYITAISNNRVMEGALGYYINPLVNILLGFVFLKERLERIQWICVALAFTGVAILGISQMAAPTVPLILAFSFGLYGLVRKIAHIDAFVGLFIETAMLAPFFILVFAVRSAKGEGSFGPGDPATSLLLLLAGVVTAVPLVLFIIATHRLRLMTIGFLQFLSPSLQFILAISYGEPLNSTKLATFAFIWTALVIYSVDAWRRMSVTKSP